MIPQAAGRPATAALWPLIRCMFAVTALAAELRECRGEFLAQTPGDRAASGSRSEGSLALPVHQPDPVLEAAPGSSLVPNGAGARVPLPGADRMIGRITPTVRLPAHPARPEAGTDTRPSTGTPRRPGRPGRAPARPHAGRKHPVNWPGARDDQLTGHPGRRPRRRPQRDPVSPDHRAGRGRGRLRALVADARPGRA